MKKWIERRSFVLLVVAAIALMLQACGAQDGSESSGEMIVVNEDAQEISLTNKERATVLFHFTEVGWGLCQQQLVQLQENIHLFEDIDADMYAISIDSPDNHKRLKEAGAFTFSFLTDQSFEVLEEVKMKNDEMSYRGVSILDKNGTYVYHEINDHWGEQIEETAERIYEQLEKLNN